MVKDLFESSHKSNESAGTKSFLLVKDITTSTETHPPDRIPSQFTSVTSFYSVVLCLVSTVFSPLRLDLSGRLRPSFFRSKFHL
jgi:hypothetical protein